jgi:type II secretory pathway pseudopilin PulG
MRIGERFRDPDLGPRPRGFTYLALLGAVLVAGALLAAAGTAWSGRAEREAERELLFRGGQIALALARWHAAVPGAPGPQRLEDLLLDSRTSPPQRHLRRLWADPASGEADWVLERDEQGAIVGLRSASERPAQLLRGVNEAPGSMGSQAGLAPSLQPSPQPSPALREREPLGLPTGPLWRDHVFGVASSPQPVAGVVPTAQGAAPDSRRGVKPAP